MLPLAEFTPCQPQGHQSEARGTWLGPTHHTQLLPLAATFDHFLYPQNKERHSHSHSHTHTRNVIQVRGEREARGGRSPSRGTQNTRVEVLSTSGKG